MSRRSLKDPSFSTLCAEKANVRGSFECFATVYGWLEFEAAARIAVHIKESGRTAAGKDRWILAWPLPPLSPRSGIKSLPTLSVWRIHKELQVKPILLALSFDHGFHSKCNSCSTHVIFFKTKCQILKKTIPRPLPFAKGFVKSFGKEAFGSNWFVYRLGLFEVYLCLLMNSLICRESQFFLDRASGFFLGMQCRHSGGWIWSHKCIDDWESQARRLQGYRDCFGEDCLSSQLLIKAMADVCEIGNTVPVELKSSEEEIRESRLNYTEDKELK
ncbi:hypothetical protein SELMODRAFT_404343 [Selaginella moellendorffii]|uniref:Uncharacterized protein n=1 Tax=Selaginella moellendorffii TaxID=88036 RepID=D8QV13_SELML|nr:hypothetical protein SELMODRAFT_404343 [Selaginella moellendorffii]